MDNGAVIAGISLVASGYERLHFSRWFSDWEYPSKQNHNGDPMMFPDDEHLSISGRYVDVAIYTEMFDRILRTGWGLPRHSVDPITGAVSAWQDYGDSMPAAAGHRMYSAPLVAIRIGDDWVEPSIPNNRLHHHNPAWRE